MSTRESRPLPSWKGWIQEGHDEDRGDEQRVQRLLVEDLARPGDRRLHLARRVEGARGLEHDAVAVAQQGAVQLADVVLGRVQVGVGLEHQVHRLGVARHLLLLTPPKGHAYILKPIREELNRF